MRVVFNHVLYFFIILSYIYFALSCMFLDIRWDPWQVMQVVLQILEIILDFVIFFTLTVATKASSVARSLKLSRVDRLVLGWMRFIVCLIFVIFLI